MAAGSEPGPKVRAPSAARPMAKLASARVSMAFRYASSPHADSMAEPPLDTKGKVTPVRGSRSMAPKMFRAVCTTMSEPAAQAAMV